MFQHPRDKDEACIPFLSAVSTSAFVNGRAVSLVLELLRQDWASCCRSKVCYFLYVGMPSRPAALWPQTSALPISRWCCPSSGGLHPSTGGCRRASDPVRVRGIKRRAWVQQRRQRLQQKASRPSSLNQPEKYPKLRRKRRSKAQKRLQRRGAHCPDQTRQMSSKVYAHQRGGKRTC